MANIDTEFLHTKSPDVNLIGILYLTLWPGYYTLDPVLSFSSWSVNNYFTKRLKVRISDLESQILEFRMSCVRSHVTWRQIHIH